MTSGLAPSKFEAARRGDSLYWPFIDRSGFRRATRLLGIVSAFAILVALYFAFMYAPTAAWPDGKPWPEQRIFYFHVSSAWTGFLAFFVVFVASIAYLWKGGRQWDVLALSSAEIGIVLTTLVLLTGPLWAKTAWGVFWTWDARLTTTLILWLIYVGYLMLRNYAGSDVQRARFAAVLGIVGFLDVPIIYLSVQWWRTQHPQLMILTPEGPGLAPQMLHALIVALVAFTLLYVFLLALRVRLERNRDVVALLKEAKGR